MKISIAQIKPIKGDVLSNIKKHETLIEIASSLNASSIFFPELSLTSYEPALAKNLATDQNDLRLDLFQKISNKNKITIGVGLPTKSTKGINISMVVFQPNQLKQTYSKQHLHSDEFGYFEKGNEQLILTVENHKIAPAICYESLQAEHSDNAIKLGANVYLASVAKAEKGFDKAIEYYSALAKKHALPVLMANSIGYCDNFISVGQSSVWTKNGTLAGQLDEDNEGLLIFNTETEKVKIEIL